MNIVGCAEAAGLLGIGKTNFSHLRRKREGVDPAFPLPVIELACGPIWLHGDMVAFAAAYNARRRKKEVVVSYEELLADMAVHVERWKNEAKDIEGFDGKAIRKLLERLEEDVLDPI